MWYCLVIRYKQILTKASLVCGPSKSVLSSTRPFLLLLQGSNVHSKRHLIVNHKTQGLVSQTFLGGRAWLSPQVRPLYTTTSLPTSFMSAVYRMIGKCYRMHRWKGYPLNVLLMRGRGGGHICAHVLFMWEPSEYQDKVTGKEFHLSISTLSLSISCIYTHIAHTPSSPINAHALLFYNRL